MEFGEFRAIADDACSKDENCLYVFQGMIEDPQDVYSCRERLVNIIKASPTTTNHKEMPNNILDSIND